MGAAEHGDGSLLIDYYVETTRLHVERARHYETQSQSLMALAGTLLGIVAATAAAADPPLLPVILAVLPLSLAVVCSAQSRSFAARERNELLARDEDAIDRLQEVDAHSTAVVVAIWRRRAHAAQREQRRAATWATATLVSLVISSAPLAAIAVSAAS